MILVLTAALLLLTSAGFWLGRSRAFAVGGGHTGSFHSRPQYHGMYVALWCALPSFLLVAVWLVLEPLIAEWLLLANLPADVQALDQNQLRLLVSDIKRHALGNIVSRELEPAMQIAADGYARFRDIAGLAMVAAALSSAVMGLSWARRRIAVEFRARNRVEKTFDLIMVVASTVAILTTVGIVLSLLFEALLFFGRVSFVEFLFGLHWSPQMALRAEQVGSSGSFGAVPLFAGTLLIAFVAMCVAAPIGLFSAIYMSEYAGPRLRATAKPMLEILAGVPTVVYGFFAALTMAPFVRDVGEAIGVSVASESALAAGIVMGIMIIPLVSSLSDDVMNAVPQTLRDGAYALGATKSETIKQVIIPAALPGIVGGMLLAVSRAIGETMIVVMAAGLAANLTANPLEPVTTVTVQIVTLLVGDQEFDSAKTLAAFALGLVLFLATLGLNVIALHVVRKYREQYD